MHNLLYTYIIYLIISIFVAIIIIYYQCKTQHTKPPYQTLFTQPARYHAGYQPIMISSTSKYSFYNAYLIMVEYFKERCTNV